MATGRFAPSPTGDLHLGNLRTALLAWLFARSAGSRFLVRVEDLDPVTSGVEHEARQLADLAALGLDWDGPVIRQSARRSRHDELLAALVDRELTYPCYCSRREVREAAAAPHVPPGTYPGTCRDLPPAERAAREASGRPAALRLRASGSLVTVRDRLHGEVTRPADDIVLRRNDGVVAYHLAVVVDDHDQGVEEVVRGDDLLDATPSQANLIDLLGLPRPSWAHVPLVLGPDGDRLAKRHGAVTLADLVATGLAPDGVRSLLAASLGLAAPGEVVTMGQLRDRFDPSTLPREAWVLDPSHLPAS
jgi:glutamyl-tRNA synthetase